METIQLDLQLSTVPDVMKRGEHALIAMIDEQGRYVLGQKNRYPEGISRLAGGGMEPGENPELAALRELYEEVGLKLDASDLQPIAKIVANISCPTLPEPIMFTTYLYGIKVNSASLVPTSDLDGLAYVSSEQMKQLIDRYAQLPTQVDEKVGFAWADYGKLYGPLHQLVLDRFRG